MKRFITIIVLACAVISAGAQIIDLNPSAIRFTSPEPERPTETIGSVRLGTIKIIRDYLSYGLITSTSYGEPFSLDLGETKFRALVTMDDVLSLFDLQDGQTRTFLLGNIFEYQATKVGKNSIHLQRRIHRGHMVLTRNQCERLIAKLKAYNPDL